MNDIQSKSEYYIGTVEDGEFWVSAETNDPKDISVILNKFKTEDPKKQFSVFKKVTNYVDITNKV